MEGGSAAPVLRLQLVDQTGYIADQDAFGARYPEPIKVKPTSAPTCGKFGRERFAHGVGVPEFGGRIRILLMSSG